MSFNPESPTITRSAASQRTFATPLKHRVMWLAESDLEQSEAHKTELTHALNQLARAVSQVLESVAADNVDALNVAASAGKAAGAFQVGTCCSVFEA